MNPRNPRNRGTSLVIVFTVLAVTIGSYKFIENQIHYGRPIVHGMDFGQPWVRAQQPTVTGPASYVDVDLRKLLREPYAVQRDGQWNHPHSIPLLLYATFWHPYIPTSNFNGTSSTTHVVAQATYLLALIPTALIIAGLSIAIRRQPLGRLAIAFLALNVALVLAAGLRYDAWSCFQSRLYYPSFAAIALALGWGMEACGRMRAIRLATEGVLISLYVAFMAYFAIEVWTVSAKYFGL